MQVLYYIPFSIEITIGTLLFLHQCEKFRSHRTPIALALLTIAALLAGLTRLMSMQIINFVAFPANMPGMLYYPVFAVLLVILIHWLSAISWLEALITVSAGYASQHIAFAILQMINTENLLETPYFIMVYCLVFCMVYVILWAMMGRNFTVDQEKIRNMPQRILLSFIVLILAFQCNVVITDMANAGLLSKSGATLCHFYDVICSTLALIILVMASNMDRLANDLAVIRHIDALKEQYYEINRTNIDLINTKFHDVRKNLAQLRRMAQNLQNVGIASSIPTDTIQQMENSIRIYDSIFNTGDDALDTLLTEKSFYCAQHNIELTAMADGKAIAFMDRSDIYSLFGNILDNAIEAVTLLPDTNNRQITFTVHANGRLLRIEEENYFNGLLKIENGLPVTTKTDRRFHGFGMRSIARQVAKYHGEMTINTDDQVFSLSIVIPIPK